MTMTFSRPHEPGLDSLSSHEAALLVDEYAQVRAAEALASETPDHEKAAAFMAVGNTAINALNYGGMGEETGAAVLRELNRKSKLIESLAPEQRTGDARNPKFANALVGLIFEVGDKSVPALRARIAQRRNNPASPTASSTSESENNPYERLVDRIVEASGDSVQFHSDSRTGLTYWGPDSQAELGEKTGGGRLKKICDTPWIAFGASKIVKDAANATDPRDVPVEAVAFTYGMQFVAGVRQPKKSLFGRVSYTQKSVNHYEDAVVETDNGTERLIDVCYTFNPRLAGDNTAYAKAENDLYHRNKTGPVPVPAYQSPYTAGGGSHRLGSSVNARFALPESIAVELQQALAPDDDEQRKPGENAELAHPEIIRAVVDKLAVKHGSKAISTNEWYGSEAHPYPVRPPYEDLPADWSLHVFDGIGGTAQLATATSEFDRQYGHRTATFRGN